MILTDNETAIDYLYYETVAKTVVSLIRMKSEDPLTIGLHGDWGAGKSSTLLMIENSFAADDRTLCVRFNGWLFEGYDDAKAVLIETIVEELLKKRSGVTKVADKAADVLKSVNWFKVARTAGGAAISFATGLPNSDIIQGLSGVAKQVIENPGDVLTGEVFNKVMAGAADHFKATTPSDNAPQRMHAFREDFKELLSRADIDRLIVLIDDLDRCLPATAIATLEAIRLFLFIPNAAFVIAADEGMIEYAVRNHFPDLPASSGASSYARSYLEKLIQVPFRMPALGAAETRVYLTLLLFLSNGVDASSKEFKSALEIAREALKRPWLSSGFDRATIGTKIKPIPDALDAALQVAAQITPILTEGARGNPRQIKRFVNTMALRTAIADERGFKDEIKQAVLAKLMLAERFAPEVFDAISLDASAEGSKVIAALEASTERTTTKKTSSKKDISSEVSIETWPNIEWARRWSKIEPSLIGLDLRPYVFVSRDRRAVFTSGPTLGPLEELIERLSSTSILIRQVTEAEIATLTPSDAERVFQALISKIDATTSLESRPVAAEGLAVLCGFRAELAEPLIAYLGRLPMSKVGAWVMTGWGKATQGTHADKFANLINQWAEQNENKRLQTVAKIHLSTSKSKGQ